MSGEVLRRAAALMRERAELAPDGPWLAGERCVWGKIPGFEVVTDGPDGKGGATTETGAEHIASWHPAVALAVADWLDREVDAWEGHYDEWWSMHTRAWDRANNGRMPTDTREHFQRTATEYADGQHRPAPAVASAYLGES